MSDPEFYESDSPCKCCGGVLRFRDAQRKGQCVGCTDTKDARNYILTSSAPQKSGGWDHD